MKSVSKKHLASLLYFLLPVIAVFSGPNLIGVSYTGWDTHNIGFPSFLYFSDSIASGFIPLWNPFVQSGTFFPSLNNIGLFSPFQLPFAVIAHFVSPVLVYEWLIQFVVLMGGLGAYYFCRSAKLAHDLACLGATIYIITSLLPNVGQLSFVFSLSTLSWLLAAAHFITSKKTLLIVWVLFGLLCGFAMASGYPWMNIVNIAIFSSYTLLLLFSGRNSAKTTVYQFVTFLLASLLTYGLLLLPGYNDLNFSYANFAGDFISPDGRLRGISNTTLEFNRYYSIWAAIQTLISPITFGIPFWGWSLGVGLITCLLLVTAALKKPRLESTYYFWIAIALFGLFYAVGMQPVLSLTTHLPFFSSNRWGYLGLDYSVISLLILTLLWTQDAFGRSPFSLPDGLGKGFFEYLILLTFLLLLFYTHLPFAQLSIVLITIAFLTFKELRNNRRRQIYFLSLLAVADVLLVVRVWPSDDTYGSPFLRDKSYAQQIKYRTVSPVVIDQNIRFVSHNNAYDSTSGREWYIDKIPYSHGYNNLGNPVYWYVKSNPIISQIFSLTNNVRLEKIIHRGDYESDNSYVNAIVDDILLTPEQPTVDTILDVKRHHDKTAQGKILHTELQPNKGIVTVEIEEPSLVIFSNNYAPGWKVFEDGKEVPLVKVNHLFMAAEIRAPGRHIIVFEFNPASTVIAILLPYVALLIFCLLWFGTRRHKQLRMRGAT